MMLWYVCYLISFGLGFYILLHDVTEPMNSTKGNDTQKKNSSCCNSGQNSKFDNPFLTLTKTSTMFVGEFDFDDLPIRGGDISVSMVYIFLLVFIFHMVILIMNLSWWMRLYQLQIILQ